MLQTDEVDDDYFTPVQSTSLANIFGTTSAKEDNESLKYIPPKPSIAQKPDDSKLTQCLYACVVVGHEWSNNNYVNRGKLGIAILKIPKTGTANIVLYDSNKITLSCTSITTNLEITIDNNHISYYDNLKKFWCIYSTEIEINKIIDQLKPFNVIVKHKSEESQHITPAANKNVPEVSEEIKKQFESDTDSSVNKKTKMSILSRMASMGHSVLPAQSNHSEKLSDSSDTTDEEIQTKVVRHKPVKNIMKRNQFERNVITSEANKIIDSQQRLIVHKREQHMDQNPLYTNIDGVLMPIQSSNVITGLPTKSTELDFFMTEQRVSNSEMRININRISDKIDLIMNKMNSLETKDASNVQSNFQMEIQQKLLLEYEKKIKMYENYFKSNGINIFDVNEKNVESSNNKIYEIEIMETKIKELEMLIVQKNNELAKCNMELNKLQDIVDEEAINIKTNDELVKKVAALELEISSKNEQLSASSKENEVTHSKAEIISNDRLKMIMNETYSVISNNFVNSEMYDGETIKKVIAGVIRRVTVESLSPN